MRWRARRAGGTIKVASTTAGRMRPLQRDVLRDVMLSADECETWLTLEELARITLYPPASISAQLRHLRKPRYGSFRLEKRCRARARDKARLSSVLDVFAQGPVWEYRLRSPRAGRRGATRARGGGPWA